MPIDSLYLEKFRLFDSKKIELSPERSLIVGKNGSGKTSILEALEILFSGKSFRLSCSPSTEYGDNAAFLSPHRAQAAAFRVSAAMASRRSPVSQVPGAAM